MTLSERAIHNASFTGIVLGMITMLGVVSFWTMPRSEDPQFETPTVRVNVVYPGASPEDIEQLVVDPLEEAIDALDDIDTIESTTRDGGAVIVTEFLQSVDTEDAEESVDEAVAQVRGRLPSDIRAIDVRPLTTSDVAVYQLALTSAEAPYRQLDEVSDRLEQRLERIGDVKDVERWAVPDQEVRIALDMDRLRETNLPVDQVIGAIQSESQTLPGGDLNTGARRFAVQTSGDYESVAEVSRTVVASSENSVVRLSDVAAVELRPEEIRHRGRFNGERAVFVTVTQRDGANIFNVLDAVKAEVEAFRTRQLPANIGLHEVFDQSESVDARIGGFFASLLQGIGLVGLVVLLALGFRASVIVMLSLPLSISMALFGLDATGYGLQQISIVGLVIALGLLVDDAIVITENVARYRRKGRSGLEAAVKGTREVGYAVVSTSVTSILAFVPVVLIQSPSGAFIRSMPVTVIYVLIASLLVALTAIPLLASREESSGGSTLLRRLFGADAPSNDDRSASSPEASSSSGRSGPLDRVLQRAIEGPYRWTLDWALSHRGWVLAIAVGALVGSVSLFPLIGVSFFPAAEKPQFLVNVTMPEGASLEATDRAVRRVERFLESRSDVRRYAANVGRDNPIVYYNVIPRRERASIGQVYVEATRTEAVPQLVSDLEAALSNVPGATYGFEIFKNGPPVEAPVAIKVIGPNLQTLNRLAAEVETLMRTTPGTATVENPLREPKTDLKVRVDRDRAGLLGVRTAEVDRAVRVAVDGLTVGQYRDANGENRDLVLALQGEAQMSDFDRVIVSSASGRSLPLRQVAEIEFADEPPRIDHFQTERAVTITADVNPDSDASAVSVTQAVVRQLDQIRLPPEYRTFVGGELEAQEDSFASLLPALIGAVLGILAVLVLQFGSIVQAMIILAAIPLSVVGAFPALLLTGYTFSFTAFIGFTSLVGIVVNNSTILVDYANQLMDDGASVTAAIREASATRFSPILLTTLTTIGGLLPLTLTDTELWSPLGWVIIGGLLVSTLLTLIVVPVLYHLLTTERSDRRPE
jgi:multidrug efflux pump subunit AcrB